MNLTEQVTKQFRKYQVIDMGGDLQNTELQ